MADAEERLRQSQESKVKANEKASEAVTKLEELHENVEKISGEQSNLEKELKIEERECELLCAMQGKDPYNQVLQKKIDKKRKKIKRLKEELQSRYCEFQSAVQEAQNREEELLQARKELKKQHEQVIKLQREKEELAWSYNIEKKQVSKIVQLLVSDKEEMQVTSSLYIVQCTSLILITQSFDYILNSVPKLISCTNNYMCFSN